MKELKKGEVAKVGNPKAKAGKNLRDELVPFLDTFGGGGCCHDGLEEP